MYFHSSFGIVSLHEIRKMCDNHVPFILFMMQQTASFTYELNRELNTIIMTEISEPIII